MADIVAVTLPDNSTYNFKDSRVSKPVPADAAFTDHEYESKSAASGGTEVSLVTTGEKYMWNNKAAADSSATVSLPLASWSSSTLTLSATISGATTSMEIKGISLVSGDLSDYLRVVSAEITADNTVTFTARALPEAAMSVKVTYA